MRKTRHLIDSEVALFLHNPTKRGYFVILNWAFIHVWTQRLVSRPTAAFNFSIAIGQNPSVPPFSICGITFSVHNPLKGFSKNFLVDRTLFLRGEQDSNTDITFYTILLSPCTCNCSAFSHFFRWKNLENRIRFIRSTAIIHQSKMISLEI